MNWKHCLELLLYVLIVGSVAVLMCLVVHAIIRGYRETRSLRQPAPAIAPRKEGDTEESRRLAADHWKRWRDRLVDYGKDLNQIANPLRRDALEIVKESSNWGRLGIQYALIANGGALAALPYLLNQSGNTYNVEFNDALWAARWFTLGLAAALLCCIVAYLDFQLTAASYWASHRLELAHLHQRHFETEGTAVAHDATVTMINAVQAVNVRTSLAGVWLGFVSWFGLAWGVFRLIGSMGP